MGKFGKKNSVDLNPLHYNICLLGESGIGKTTIIKEVCERMVGQEGYIHFDMGREDGAHAIEGIVTEPMENWAKINEVCNDIIENKAADYADLQVVVWDTLDEWINLAEAESIRLYNRKQQQEGTGKKADTILEAWSGFGRGQDKAADLMLDKIWDLKRVGVNSIIIGHVKRSDIIDPVTNATYSKLTADSTQRYFNKIKNKMDFIGLAYIDRSIVEEKTGRKDVRNHDITINKAVSESRVISFRDDTYSVDSKCRFANIVDHIEFDSDKFIKAMQDAIAAERDKSGKTVEESQKLQAEKDAVAATEAAQYSQEHRDNAVDEKENDRLVGEIKAAFKTASAETKVKIRDIMKAYGVESINAELPTKILKEIAAVL